MKGDHRDSPDEGSCRRYGNGMEEKGTMTTNHDSGIKAAAEVRESKMEINKSVGHAQKEAEEEM